MLDRKLILEQTELVKTNCQRRGVSIDIDRLVHLENDRKACLAQAQELNRQANEVSKRIGKAGSPEEREELKEQGRQLREQKDAAQARHDDLDAEVRQLQSHIPNLTHPDVPIGEDDTANTQLSLGKTPVPQFDFQPQDHLELGKAHELVDFEAGARVAGAGFYFLKNDAVLLDLALQQFAISELVRRGFTPLTTPDVAHNQILQGIGFMPRGPETQIYSIEQTDLNLVATAEITLGGMLADQVLDAEQLPLKLVGLSHCFRTEAGAAGRASKGLYRVHQFTKIEMFPNVANFFRTTDFPVRRKQCEIDVRAMLLHFTFGDTCRRRRLIHSERKTTDWEVRRTVFYATIGCRRCSREIHSRRRRWPRSYR
jgi:seryl-tRNA synthetase